MTPFRWKMMAGILGLSVGGLAVFADPPAADPLQAPVRPAVSPETTLPPPAAVNAGKSPTQGAVDTTLPAQPGPGLELQLPVITPVSGSTPTAAQQPSAPHASTPQAGSGAVPAPLPTLPSPGAGLEVVPAAASRKAEGKPAEALRAPREDAAPTRTPEKAQPSVALEPIQPPAAPGEKREPTSPVTPAEGVPAPLVPAGTASTPATPAAPLSPAPSEPPAATTAPAPAAGPAPAATSGKSGDKVKMLMRLGSGSPRFEIRNPNGETVLLKVSCERIEMKPVAEQAKGSQLAGVTANGKVKFTGPGLEGTCDQLSVLSGTGELLLQGSIHLKTRSGKTWSELNAEKMVYQIGASGLISSSNHRSGVTPAAYRPE